MAVAEEGPEQQQKMISIDHTLVLPREKKEKENAFPRADDLDPSRSRRAGKKTKRTSIPSVDFIKKKKTTKTDVVLGNEEPSQSR